MRQNGSHVSSFFAFPFSAAYNIKQTNQSWQQKNL